MAKPICFIKIDLDAGMRGGKSPNLYELQVEIQARLSDYYVFVVPMAHHYEQPQDPIQMQVFHEKDFTDIQFAELKKLIEDSVKNVPRSAVSD